MNREALANDTTITQDPQIMAQFPKVELHRHLEGTFHLPTLHAMALRNGLDVPQNLGAFAESVQFPVDSEPDFLKFLSLFRNDWYRSLEDVAEIARASVASAAEDGMVYLEIRFSPEHFAAVNSFERPAVIEAVLDGIDAGAAEGGFLARSLITFNRSKQKPEEMIELYQIVDSVADDRIVGVDLAGDELNFPPEMFRPFFDVVQAEGRFKSTIHAGEVTGPEQIWEAVDHLGAARIGHGVASLQDEKLQRHLIEKKVALELCITSNYQTGSWADQESHPFGRLLAADVPVTLNSDDPTIQNSTLTDDYVKAATYFSLSLSDLEATNLLAIKSSFLDDATKESLLETYQNELEAFRTDLEDYSADASNSA